MCIHISKLDNGVGNEEILVMHNAKWYKVFYALCNAKELERAMESHQ